MRITLWLSAFFAVMLLASVASAEDVVEHKVEPGETLIKISRQYDNIKPQQIKEANPIIKSIHRIDSGWVLKIPAKKKVVVPAQKKTDETIVETGDKKVEAQKPVSVKTEMNKVKTKKSPRVTKALPPAKEYIPGGMGLPRKFYDTKNIGRAPTTMSNDKAFSKILLPPSVKEKLKLAVARGEGIDSFVSPGDQFLMTYGQEGVGDFTLRHHSQLFAKQYLVEDGGLIYDIRLIAWCRNWTRYREFPPAIEPPPSKPPTAVLGPPVEEEEPFEYLPAPEKHWTIEHEPIIGAWVWQNELARGWGGYAEYMAWLRKGRCYEFENGWSPGIGIYGMYSEGESRASSYNWDEDAFGGQAGIKYIAGGLEDPWQWQLKLRLVWEDMDGGNAEGYHMDQDHLKLGFYTEYVEKEDEGFLWGITGEAWFGLDGSIDSSWSGDIPSKRGMAAINLFGQWKLNEDWQLRLSGGPFYQEWDRLTGIHLQAEFRWNETIMFGPYISFFPFGLSSVYDGISAMDLTTPGAFVRVEFGKPIRDYYANKRMEAVKAADRQWLDDLLKTKFANET
ncbi:MAG: hypothetical protein UR66_C0019G0007 [Candidatus Moranbacteria bacterium GW2011_GWE1_35_17]|nr:MAG: hypothetical protein UR66_C0019G0007 [Candidatus Moranbacteria bacterium GW2011_GWE1_35_17]HCU01306.1 hypothetical protein [Candidatus Nomurabacteria bacterium]